MKIKITIFITLLMMIILPTHSFSAPAYGTRMPEKGKFNVGAQTYRIFHNDLEGTEGKLDSTQHFVLLSYGVTDWFSIDTKGGVGDIHQKPRGGEEISYPSFMAGGYGFRLKIFEEEQFKSVFGFQHISVHPYQADVGPVKNKSVLDDWQFSLLTSVDLDRVVPYVGGRWSRRDYIHWVDGVRDRKKSDPDKSWGLITGIDIPLHERFWLNFEGSFFDSKAFAGSLNYAF